MMKTKSLVFCLAFSVLALAPARGQDAEQRAWKALNRVIPSHTYPPQGAMVRTASPPLAEMLAKLDGVLAAHAGTSAEPVAAFYRANTLFELERFEDAAAAFRKLQSTFPDHGLCRAASGAKSQVGEAIADCEDEIAIRKVYRVQRLPHAVLDDSETCVIHTTLGDFSLGFYKDAAPKTVANFKELARQGFYNDTYFHHVMSFRRVTGGCPNTKNNDRDDDGAGSSGEDLPTELNDALHTAGAVSMVAVPGGRSHGCQFVISVHDQPDLNNESAVFARITDGLEVARLISQQRTDDSGNPYDSVRIRSIEFKSKK
ncbi:MAG: peptidylprolyl isomerase [Planctomycetes bacterium]|nr:peptidylprolyl isomerase [Planctomycetota bacterium]